MNELPHGGAHDDHVGFTGGAQACAHLADRGIAAQSGQRREVQRFSQSARPDFDHPGGFTDRAGLVHAWDDAGKGRGLTRTRVRFVEEFGDEHGGGCLADARNAGEEIALGTQVGVLIEVIPNLLLHGRDAKRGADTVRAIHAATGNARLEFVQALQSDRVEQYLALLTTDGPLVPIGRTPAGKDSSHNDGNTTSAGDRR